MKKNAIKLILMLIVALGLIFGLVSVSSYAANGDGNFAYYAQVKKLDGTNSGKVVKLSNISDLGLKKGDHVELVVMTFQNNKLPIFGIEYDVSYSSGFTPVKETTNDNYSANAFNVSEQNSTNLPVCECTTYNFGEKLNLCRYMWMDTSKSKFETLPDKMIFSYEFQVTDAADLSMEMLTHVVLIAGNNQVTQITESKTDQGFGTSASGVGIVIGPIVNGTCDKFSPGETTHSEVLKKSGECKFKIIPNSGYKIKTVTINGKTYDEFTVDADGIYERTLKGSELSSGYTISAECVFDGYIVSVSKSGNGHIDYIRNNTVVKSFDSSLIDIAEIPNGNEGYFKFVPDNGESVSCVKVNDKEDSTAKQNKEYTFPKTTTGDSSSLYVEFTENGSGSGGGGTQGNQFTITASSDGNATISPTTQYVTKGSSATFTIDPNDSKIIDKVYIDGVELTDMSKLVKSDGDKYTYTFENVQEGHTLSVTTMDSTYTVNITLSANGSLTPKNGSKISGPVQNRSLVIDSKTTKECTINAESGYHISGLTRNGVAFTKVQIDNLVNNNNGVYTISYAGSEVTSDTLVIDFAKDEETGGGGSGSGGSGGGGSGSGGSSSGGSGSGGSGGGGSGGGGSGDGGSGGGSVDTGKDDPVVDTEKHGTYQICLRDATCTLDPFTDLNNNGWYHDGVHYCIENGLMNGIGDGLFSPSGTTTRAMIVTILYRLEGSPYISGNGGFDDVKFGSWYTDAVAWAQKNGIVKGYSDKQFGPNDYITREQMATILYRYSEYKGYDLSASNDLSAYTDRGRVSSWALDGMKWANGAGIITGRTATTLVPRETATRAEAATMLQRYCVSIVK